MSRTKHKFSKFSKNAMLQKLLDVSHKTQILEILEKVLLNIAFLMDVSHKTQILEILEILEKFSKNYVGHKFSNWKSRKKNLEFQIWQKKTCWTLWWAVWSCARAMGRQDWMARWSCARAASHVHACYSVCKGTSPCVAT